MTNSRSGWVLALSAATFLVAGCASSPPIVDGRATESAPSRGVLASTAEVTKRRATFSVSGRFSAKNGKEQLSGQFRYAQTELAASGSAALSVRRTLSLFSPLGTPVAEIFSDRDAATLTLANGDTQSAPSMADMLRAVIDIPVTDDMLSAWLQGLPANPRVLGLSGVELDASGRPARFVELGWEIVVSARTDGKSASDQAAGVAGAPSRMRWSWLAVPETEVRWVIDDWQASQ